LEAAVCAWGRESGVWRWWRYFRSVDFSEGFPKDKLGGGLRYLVFSFSQYLLRFYKVLVLGQTNLSRKISV